MTVSGEGVILAVPDRAEIAAGVETRAQTARAALQANAVHLSVVYEPHRPENGPAITIGY